MRRWFRVLRTPVGVTGFGLLTLVLVLAVVAPILWGDQADAVDTDNLLAGPSADHWLGTDSLGRDIFYRVLVATRLSVTLALLATTLGVVVGLVLGAAPLLLGRRSGRMVTATVNVLVAFPGLLLVLFLAVVFGVGATGAVLAVGLAGAPAFARLCQTLIAGVAERDYVSAARIAGVGRLRILVRHVLPNVAEPLIVNVTIGAGGVLLSFAGLSFLGLGVQQPAYDWGRLMQEGLAGIYIHPFAALAPGIAVIIAALAFNLTGEAIAGAVGVSAATGLADPVPHVERSGTPPSERPPTMRPATPPWCSTSAVSASASPARTGRSARCVGCPSGSVPARRWASSASRGRASPSLPWPSPDSSRSPAAWTPTGSSSAAPTCSAIRRRPGPATTSCSAPRCRWSSRTR
jgi:ABC-type dipeptide/oligopeptide/nickel transport system permease subunit